ncbi:MAG: MFS transporter, partial [Kiritimatiellae bacterium]|nr:MFS transporter [Kiritimatiellia bacterium]
MNDQKKVWFLAIVAALGGFLFGFDTIVISGAEQDIQRVWSLSAMTHGWVMSAALWGTVIGSLIGGGISDCFGRKKTLFWVGVFYLVSAVWSGFATGPVSMIIARFIGGLGVGVSTVAAPVYISEISPPESRGKMTALFQFNIVFGVLLSLVSNL